MNSLIQIYGILEIKDCDFIFSLVRTCNNKSTIIIVALFYLFNIPYLFVASKLIRRLKLTHLSRCDTSSFFCIAKTVSFLIYTILNFNFTFNVDLIYGGLLVKMFQFPKLLQFVAQIYFFTGIAKILNVFSVPGAKIFIVLSYILYYPFLFILTLMFFLMFIFLPEKVEFELYGTGKFLLAAFIIRKVLFCLEIVILSALVIFSKTKEYFPPKIRRPFKVAIFLFCLADFITYVLNQVLISKVSLRNVIPTFFHFLILIYDQIGDLSTLFIIALLSIPEYNEKTENIDQIFSESIVSV